MQYELFGKQISGRFTIPSGIVTTMPDTIARIAREVPQIGILTTKSIGLEPRAGNKEPIYATLEDGLYVNAVGLANPGAEAYAKELAEIYPLDNKFLLASIYANKPEDFQKVAKILEPYCDGFELNFSCPHAAPGYGANIGCSPELTSAYTKAVKEATKKPIFVKLTPNVEDIGKIAQAAIESGVDGITAINTVGPLETPMLSYGKGGLSGPGIKYIGIRAVRKIRDTANELGKSIPIIGMGGIAGPNDIEDYEKAGANFFGIGSALTGMRTRSIRNRFNDIVGYPTLGLGHKLLEYNFYKIMCIEQPTADIKIFYFDGEIGNAIPGQFVFAKVGHEKPFSIADDRPLTIAVRKVGDFTSKMFELKEGDRVAIRGPYGNGVRHESANSCLVGGGTGIAPVHFLAKTMHAYGNEPTIFIGARSKDQLLFVNELSKYGNLIVSTDDGTYGIKGTVADAMASSISKTGKFYAAFNCGPEQMLKRVLEVEKKSGVEFIQALIERYMKCGVGICGSCSIDGLRACVDGPVFEYKDLMDSKDFGKRKRDASGTFIEIR